MSSGNGIVLSDDEQYFHNYVPTQPFTFPLAVAGYSCFVFADPDRESSFTAPQACDTTSTSDQNVVYAAKAFLM